MVCQDPTKVKTSLRILKSYESVERNDNTDVKHEYFLLSYNLMLTCDEDYSRSSKEDYNTARSPDRNTLSEYESLLYVAVLPIRAETTFTSKRIWNGKQGHVSIKIGRITCFSERAHPLETQVEM